MFGVGVFERNDQRIPLQGKLVAVEPRFGPHHELPAVERVFGTVPIERLWLCAVEDGALDGAVFHPHDGRPQVRLPADLPFFCELLDRLDHVVLDEAEVELADDAFLSHAADRRVVRVSHSDVPLGILPGERGRDVELVDVVIPTITIVLGDQIDMLIGRPE